MAGSHLLSTKLSPWQGGLGRTGARAAQILLILTVAVVAINGLLQIRLLVIPIIIALILAATGSRTEDPRLESLNPHLPPAGTEPT